MKSQNKYRKETNHTEFSEDERENQRERRRKERKREERKRQDKDFDKQFQHHRYWNGINKAITKYPATKDRLNLILESFTKLSLLKYLI